MTRQRREVSTFELLEGIVIAMRGRGGVKLDDLIARVPVSMPAVRLSHTNASAPR